MKYPALAAACLALAGCGGGGPGGSTGDCGDVLGNGGCRPPPPPPPQPEVVLKPSSTTTYAALGGSQQITEELRNSGRLENFTSELTDAASAKLSVTYNPASDAFTVKIATGGAGVNVVYDDPLYRTAFGNQREPQAGTPQLANFQYLQRGPEPGQPGEVQTFFYQTPETTTRFVTLAGFVRNSGPQPPVTSEGRPAPGLYVRSHAVEVFGSLTPAGAAPASGQATYRGDMLATAIFNDDLDFDPNLRSRLEWIAGQATVAVNFSSNTLTTEFSGRFISPTEAFPALGAYNSPNAGQSFLATGRGELAADHRTFTGTLTSASVNSLNLAIGASAMNGAMFGPTGQELGGAFRLVGAGPDQRVEIIGAFTGAK